MKINKAGLEIIKRFEGLKLEPYLCPAGIPTIGYGSVRYEDGKKVTMNDGKITEERALELLEDDLSFFENAVKNVGKWNPNEFSALVSFSFNLGVKKLLPGSTMGDAILSKVRERIGEAFLLYNKAVINGVKTELKGLTERRILERNLFLS